MADDELSIPPEPVTWTLPGAAAFNGMTYSTVTLRAPTSEETMKATAIRGASGHEIMLRLVEAVSAEHVPYDVLKTQPAWLIQQMSDYFEEFSGMPAPDPLAQWRKARREAALQENPGEG